MDEDFWTRMYHEELAALRRANQLNKEAKAAHRRAEDMLRSVKDAFWQQEMDRILLAADALAGGLLVDRSLYIRAVRLDNPIPEIGADVGDLLLQRATRAPVACRGTIRGLSIDEYEIVRHLSKDSKPWSSLVGVNDYVHCFLRNRRGWGRRFKVWYPRLFLIKPVRPEPVTAPIVANSNDGAIWELLEDVGCRPPREEI